MIKNKMCWVCLVFLKKLRNDTIPSIFDFLTHLNKNTNPRIPPTNRQHNIISNNINDSLQ